MFNAQNTIEDCIKSVLHQSPFYELIVIDGLSQDNTVNILQKYKDSISYFVSEKDKGIYDAMNKGIDASKGEYVYFIGSDDVFYSNDTLSKAAVILEKEKPDLLLGNMIYKNNVVIKPRFNSLLLLHNTIHHQGTFYNKNLFKGFRYNAEYRTIADYELNLICYLKRAKLKIKTTNQFIAICADDGLSHSRKDLFISETNSIRSKYNNPIFNIVLQTILLAKFKMINLFK